MDYIPKNIPKNKDCNRFAISDIHGCYNTFVSLLEQINIQKCTQIFLLGDLINRGKNSKKVLDLIIELQSQNYEFYVCRGNHEQSFLDAFSCGNQFFKSYLNKYGSIDLFGNETEKYLNFCHQLEYYFDIEGFYLSHAGFNFNHSNPFQDLKSMYLNSVFSQSDKHIGDKKIIFGHFPSFRSKIIDLVQQNSSIICIDNGCVYKEKEELGNLCALNLDTFELYFQKNID